MYLSFRVTSAYWFEIQMTRLSDFDYFCGKGSGSYLLGIVSRFSANQVCKTEIDQIVPGYSQCSELLRPLIMETLQRSTED